MKLIIPLFIFLFLSGCTIQAQYTDGTTTHTIKARRNTVVHYEDKNIEMTADFRPRRTWSLLFPALLNKANDITFETEGD